MKSFLALVENCLFFVEVNFCKEEQEESTIQYLDKSIKREENLSFLSPLLYHVLLLCIWINIYLQPLETYMDISFLQNLRDHEMATPIDSYLDRKTFFCLTNNEGNNDKM